jgi:hypothetical protein
MEEVIIIFFVGYESNVKKAIDNRVYLDFNEAMKVYRYATKTVGLDGIQLFRAELDFIEVVDVEQYKLLKSM